MYINEMFPRARSFASLKTAQAKLDRFMNDLPQFADTGFHTVIVQRPNDQRFIVVAIRGDNCALPILYFVDRGLCITNV